MIHLLTPRQAREQISVVAEGLLTRTRKGAQGREGSENDNR